jgi:dipeptidase D
MSADFDDLVETSIILLIVGEGQLSVQCLTRSSVETSKFDLANGCVLLLNWDVKWIFRFLSGWTPNSESEILDVLVPIYENKR